ncbi:glycosyltransferase [Candidatus Microgenomates bacterium]|jgi:glycosyltransferase involved in cell wall biosynthesis|nr:MAG: glycosyltransferase [Candidatus Microgenomates bacterium]
MKAVIFDINRLSFEGGAEKYFTEVGKELSKKDYDVFFIGDCRPILKFYILLGSLLLVNPVWKLPRLFAELKKSSALPAGADRYFTHIGLSLLSLVSFSRNRKKIKGILKESDLVLIKNEFIELLFYFLLGVRTNSYVLVFSSIQYQSPQSLRAFLHNLSYSSFIYKYLLKKIGKAVTSNSFDRDLLVKNFGLKKEKIHLIPYGLDKKYFADKSELKTKEGFRVLFVGRMEEQKGLLYLKQIIETINSKKTKDISFCLVGSGPLEKIPTYLASRYSNVEYKGQLSPEQVRRLYLQFDLVLITSKWETFSYVCLEAQACGVPVVSFDIPGPRDIVSLTKGGAIVPVGEIDKFTQKILHYYSLKNKNKDKYLSLKESISKAADSFSLGKTVDRLSRLS